MSGEAQGARFDPRHDPIFQRGYQPGDEPRADAAASVAHVADDPAAGRRVHADSAADPAAQLVAHVLRGTNPAASDAVAHVSAAPVSAASVNPVAPEPVEYPQANPFIRWLWIGSISMIVVALLLQWQGISRNGYGSNYSPDGTMPFEMVLQQIVWFVSSPMLLVGTLTMVALLFWHAIQWNRRSTWAATPEAATDHRRTAGCSAFFRGSRNNPHLAEVAQKRGA